jgi:5'-AMP-activated protein kinase, regulatory beta subunit
MGNQQPMNGGAAGMGADDPRMAQSQGRSGAPQTGYAAQGFAPKPGQSGPYPHSGSFGYHDAPAYETQQPQQISSQQTTVGDNPMNSADVDPKLDGGWIDDNAVPTVFRWEHGGRQVYITGTFNGWSRQIPMHRSGNDFTYIHNLKRGKHAFKFIVDDEWRFAPDQPTVADIEGRINNFIDVTDFSAYTGDREFEVEKAAAEYGTYSVPDSSDAQPDDIESIDTKEMANRPDRDGEIFSQNMPDLDEYTKEPPPLPPHLRHIILNKPPQLQDTAALPVPQHVALNHLYCTAIRDNMMVLGITQRYKTKFVTTVYYSPCAK